MVNGFDELTTCVSASRYPEAPGAVGEVAGAVIERVEPHPDLLVVLTGRGLAPSLQAMATALRSLLAPELMVAAAVTEAFTGPGPPDSLVVLTVSGSSVTSVWDAGDGASVEQVDEGSAVVDGGSDVTGLVMVDSGDDVRGDRGRAVALVDPPSSALNALVLDDRPVAVGQPGMVGFEVPDRVARLHLIDGSPTAMVSDGLADEANGVIEGATNRSMLLLAEPQVDLGRNPSLDLLYDCWPDSLAAAVVPMVTPPAGRGGVRHGYLAVALSFGL